MRGDSPSSQTRDSGRKASPRTRGCFPLPRIDLLGHGVLPAYARVLRTDSPCPPRCAGITHRFTPVACLREKNRRSGTSPYGLLTSMRCGFSLGVTRFSHFM